MATLEKAIELAARQHAGQKDKEGQPYILHPIRVMQRVEGEEAKMVAVLHDTLEDTGLTEDDLRRAGFGEEVIRGVLAVTHRPGEHYADYVVRCKALETARRVKLADLEDNARLDRAILRHYSAGRDYTRLHRYLLSYKFLTDALTEEQYRALMAAEPAH
jgi:(p)ppGpp synthase/HD superfamily hydrolase